MRVLVAHNKLDLRIEQRDVVPPGPGEVQVNIASGGICGSDLHYFQDGGFGTVRLREPMILGHEVSGHVVALGSGVTNLAVGDLVAVSPSRPCGHCKYCLEGKRNQCLNMRFYGSAMPFPHIQGAFREVLNCDAAQCAPAVGLSPGEAAVAEPLSVVLHAIRQIGSTVVRRALVTGCGPIGVLTIAALRSAGAIEIVATDIADGALAFAQRLGADTVINMRKAPDGLSGYMADKGYFDAAVECSGAPSAVAQGVACVRPQGTIVQLGLGGDMQIPLQMLTGKELRLVGSFRFHEEFPLAVEMIRSKRIDVRPLITHTLPLAEALDAFKLAANRDQAMKVQLAFN